MNRRGRTDLQIRGMPVALRDKLRARAARKGRTMSQYLIELAERDVAQPSLEEWLERLRNRPVIRHRMTGAQAVREAREERAERLAR